MGSTTNHHHPDDRIQCGAEGFRGTLENVQLSDLLQMCCTSAVSITLMVTQGDAEGYIYIDDGAIVHAASDGIEGEEALYQILSWENGRFQTVGQKPAPKQTIRKPWQSMLMEAMRRIDEAAAAARATGVGTPPADGAAEDRPIDVLIVDDSPMMCRMLMDMLSGEKGIGEVASAHNGEAALEKIDALRPDVITLDVNMPVMDGGTALKHIMIRNPCPVIVISGLGGTSGDNILDFLRLGAMDFISKPTRNETMAEQKQLLLSKVRLAARARVGNFKRVRAPARADTRPTPEPPGGSCERLVVISSGTGGYADLIQLVPTLSGGADTGLLLAPQMSRQLVPSFADYLDRRCPSRILPLDTESPLAPGYGYLCPSSNRVAIHRNSQGWVLSSTAGSDGRSDANALFGGIADAFTGRIVVVLLSGADAGTLGGLERIRRAGGRVIAQERSTCMVSEPLHHAVEAGLVDMEVKPENIAEAMAHLTI